MTACRLSCLNVEKDNPPSVESASPARRLLLTHSSPNEKPPNVFTQDPRENKLPTKQNGVIMNRSRMDLWFEDALTAGHAFKVLSTKIVRARARRGNKIRESLAQNDDVGFSTLFDSA